MHTGAVVHLRGYPERPGRPARHRQEEDQILLNLQSCRGHNLLRVNLKLSRTFSVLFPETVRNLLSLLSDSYIWPK